PGKFRVRGEGQVYLYEREGQEGPDRPKLGMVGPGAAGDGPAARRSVTRASGPGTGQAPAPRRATAVVGRNSTRNPAELKADRARTKGQTPARRPPLPPLVLTQVHFTSEMHGRFGTGKDAAKTEVRWADFFGDVE